MIHKIFLLTAFLAFTFVSFISIAHAEIQTSAKQAIIQDFETGQILLSKNIDQRMPTSSMSKVMTMYMVFDAIKRGDITLDTEFTVSEKAWKKGGSKMFVEVGKQVKVEDLIRGVIIQSGNDATIVLAEGLAGSEDAFAAAMTRKAHQLGMKNSNFMNASGWPDENHYSTAGDLATLAHAIIRDFPEHYKYYSEQEFEYSGIKQPNRNPLLYRNVGADGMKTGHTDIAGYGLIGSGKNADGRRIVMVVNGLESAKDRASESAKLFTWGLNGFENIKVFAKGETIENAPVTMGKAPSVALTVQNDITISVPKLSRDQMDVKALYDEPLIAPITAGTKVGELQITLPGTKALSYDLYTAASVEELGFFAKMVTRAKMSIGNLLGGS